MKRILVAAALLAGASSCGGGAPQEYVITLLNLQVVAGANAKCPNAQDPNVEISTPFNNDGTIYIYQGDATHWYLDTGNDVIEGTLTNGTYTFKYSNTMESKLPQPNPTADQIILDEETVTLKASGGNISGTFSSEHRQSCSNLTNDNTACQPYLFDGQNTEDCVASANVEGVQLQDPKFVQVSNTPGSGL